MAVVVSLLRGVNLGPHKRLQMEPLRALYGSLQLQDARTYVQSGNVVFRTGRQDSVQLARRIEQAIERRFGFHSAVILRTVAEMREVVAASPFRDRTDVDPSKLLVVFLAGDPGEQARDMVRQVKASPEEVYLGHRELYIYFPNGMGRSKLPLPGIEKTLRTPGTGRNWNTVTKLVKIAEDLETLEKSAAAPR